MNSSCRVAVDDKNMTAACGVLKADDRCVIRLEYWLVERISNDADRQVAKLKNWLVKWASSFDDRYVVKLERCFVKWYGTLNISNL